MARSTASNFEYQLREMSYTSYVRIHEHMHNYVVVYTSGILLSKGKKNTPDMKLFQSVCHITFIHDFRHLSNSGIKHFPEKVNWVDSVLLFAYHFLQFPKQILIHENSTDFLISTCSEPPENSE